MITKVYSIFWNVSMQHSLEMGLPHTNNVTVTCLTRETNCLQHIHLHIPYTYINCLGDPFNCSCREGMVIVTYASGLQAKEGRKKKLFIPSRCLYSVKNSKRLLIQRPIIALLERLTDWLTASCWALLKNESTQLPIIGGWTTVDKRNHNTVCKINVLP